MSTLSGFPGIDYRRFEVIIRDGEISIQSNNIPE
jgi:hypothetical protein